jgi:hypothetical protein
MGVILDLLLPGRDGLQVLGDLRQIGNKVPVLILTARDAVEDRVIGLDAGADDYLVKPFAFAELLARLRVLLRRERAGVETVLLADDLEVDLLNRRASRAGQELPLTQREFEVLVYLVRHKNQLLRGPGEDEGTAGLATDCRVYGEGPPLNEWELSGKPDEVAWKPCATFLARGCASAYHRLVHWLGSQGNMDCTACLRAEAAEFLLAQQIMRLNERQLLQGSRAAQVVERVGQLAVPPLEELEHGQVKLVTALIGIG